MDRSRENLLNGADRASFDTSDDSDAYSDIDATDYLNKNKNSQSEAAGKRRLRYLRSWRAKKCCFTVIGTLVVVWLVISAIGAFAWKKIKVPPVEGDSPPWYPSPKGGTSQNWAKSYDRAAELVGKMTLAEKVNITTGTGWSMGLAVGTTGAANNVGFPALALQDGPLGIRFADNATAWPAGITVGATFNKKLMYERGRAHGKEAKGKGVNVILGPAIGPLGRAPAGGRNWEGFGPDPYLQGIAGAATIKGIQDSGVMATIKHFIGNEQEHFRQAWEWGLPNAISSNIDDRTLHEIYGWPFQDAVKAGVASVMCSYNMVNNSYVCQNSKLLNGILKDEMGFQGFVMSDWLAQRSGVASALAGLDMSMPGDGLKWADGESLWGPRLTQAVLNGSLPVDRLNDMALRIVASFYQLGQDKDENKGPNFSSWTYDKKGKLAPGSPSPQEEQVVNQFINVQEDHAELARQIAIEGTVLLKNDGVLPLSREGHLANQLKKKNDKTKIGIFGDDAGPGKGLNYCPDQGCNEGTLGSGWGSGAADFPFLVTPVEALRKNFKKDKVQVTEHLSNKIKDPKKVTEQDVCLVFANSDAGEGYLSWNSVRGDRNDLNLQKGGDALIMEVANLCGDGTGTTIVVIHAVGPVVMENWINHPRIKAVLTANLPGEESGNAIASILFGDESPSGKLPYTIGKALPDYGEGAQILYLPNGVIPQQDFKEGLYIDYRHFDKHSKDLRYEFGYGLSYTTFEFKDLKISVKEAVAGLPASRVSPKSAAPPKLDDKIPDVKEGLWPKNIRKLKKWIYPYIDSPDDIKKGDYPYPDGYDIEQPPSQAGGEEGGNPDLWKTVVTASVTVKNTGSVDGKAVPQLYLSYPATSKVDHPVRVLRGFEKVALKKGESKKVEFELTRRDLSYWDVEEQNWRVTDGEFTIAVGESSRNLKATGTFKSDGTPGNLIIEG
ncbi:probable beta-glucosidase [Fusarium fujikuroi IMI 58289]|uniref:beta-glucosidase n=1 Tax=Gibberella fujikuroi (strain CBS 195.34 / IMI 58289 / NRRL A-6831) TaxID=1279085 RepID=S0DP34_GIBF5|nr:probable beta-glucosidase [Fusarium fujikuroi IMI 58289]CCT63152.1 probable beta-glucosidase [Fusarium fujikuroi IMI 58289]SCN71722.1 probable beta-glucosidase [Fusarium fujikuroi]